MQEWWSESGHPGGATVQAVRCPPVANATLPSLLLLLPPLLLLHQLHRVAACASHAAAAPLHPAGWRWAAARSGQGFTHPWWMPCRTAPRRCRCHRHYCTAPCCPTGWAAGGRAARAEVSACLGHRWHVGPPWVPGARVPGPRGAARQPCCAHGVHAAGLWLALQPGHTAAAAHATHLGFRRCLGHRSAAEVQDALQLLVVEEEVEGPHLQAQRPGAVGTTASHGPPDARRRRLQRCWVKAAAVPWEAGGRRAACAHVGLLPERVALAVRFVAVHVTVLELNGLQGHRRRKSSRSWGRQPDSWTPPPPPAHAAAALPARQ